MAILHRAVGADDVGHVPFAMGHYIENTGNTPQRFLEVFKSNYSAGLAQPVARADAAGLVQTHLKVDQQTLAVFHREKFPVVPV